MALAKQTYNLGAPVHDHGKQFHNVAAKDANVESFQLGEGGKFASKHSLALVVTV